MVSIHLGSKTEDKEPISSPQRLLRGAQQAHELVQLLICPRHHAVREHGLYEAVGQDLTAIQPLFNGL